MGQENLNKPEIQKAIAHGMEKRENKLEITADRVLKEFARIAFVDPRNFFNPDGSAKDITDLDEDTASALAGFQIDDLFEGKGKDRQLIGYVKKYKIADKIRALEALAKHLGITSENIRVTGFEEAIQGVYERADRAVEEYRRIRSMEEKNG
jgi:phage terminase small subunit